MYIHRISVRNIRGFESVDFNLARPDKTYAGWTVFTGRSGSGKGTLLKAIALCLAGKEAARALQPSFHRWIREGSEGESFIELEIRPCPRVTTWQAPGARQRPSSRQR
jgi:DNA repair exonuclease SbcCD ATPase subunit